MQAVIPLTEGNMEGMTRTSAAAQKRDMAKPNGNTKSNAPAHKPMAVAAERREGGAVTRGRSSRRASTLRKGGREAHTKHTHTDAQTHAHTDAQTHTTQTRQTRHRHDTHTAQTTHTTQMTHATHTRTSTHTHAHTRASIGRERL